MVIINIIEFQDKWVCFSFLHSSTAFKKSFQVRQRQKVLDTETKNLYDKPLGLQGLPQPKKCVCFFPSFFGHKHQNSTKMSETHTIHLELNELASEKRPELVDDVAANSGCAVAWAVCHTHWMLINKGRMWQGHP